MKSPERGMARPGDQENGGLLRVPDCGRGCWSRPRSELTAGLSHLCPHEMLTFRLARLMTGEGGGWGAGDGGRGSGKRGDVLTFHKCPMHSPMSAFLYHR